MKLFSRGRVAAILIAAALTVTVAGSVLATDVRHSATSGSFLVDSNRQLNALPHWAVQRDAFVEVSSGFTYYNGSRATAGDGTVRLSVALNETSNLVMRANDSNWGARLMDYAWGGSVGSPGLSSAIAASTAGEGQMFDVDWAKAMSNGGAFSVGGGIGMLKSNDDLDDEAFENTAFTLRGSFGSASGHNVSGEFMMQSPKQTQSGQDDQESDGGMNFTAYYRGDFDNGWVLNAAGYFSDPVRPKESDRDSSLGLLVSGGRNLMMTDRGQVAGEVYFDYQSKAGSNAFSRQSFDGFAIPGCRLGITQQLGGIFELMAGANAYWVTVTQKTAEQGTSGAPGVFAAAQDSDDDPSLKGFQFDYTLGLSAHFGSVSLDAEVHPEAIPTLTRFGSDDPILAALGINVLF